MQTLSKSTPLVYNSRSLSIHTRVREAQGKLSDFPKYITWALHIQPNQHKIRDAALPPPPPPQTHSGLSDHLFVANILIWYMLAHRSRGCYGNWVLTRSHYLPLCGYVIVSSVTLQVPDHFSMLLLFWNILRCLLLIPQVTWDSTVNQTRGRDPWWWAWWCNASRAGEG